MWQTSCRSTTTHRVANPTSLLFSLLGGIQLYKAYSKSRQWKSNWMSLCRCVCVCARSVDFRPGNQTGAADLADPTFVTERTQGFMVLTGLALGVVDCKVAS